MPLQRGLACGMRIVGVFVRLVGTPRCDLKPLMQCKENSKIIGEFKDYSPEFATIFHYSGTIRTKKFTECDMKLLEQLFAMDSS